MTDEEVIAKLVDGIPNPRDSVMVARLALRARDMVEAEWSDGGAWRALGELRAAWSRLLEYVEASDDA